MWLADRLSNLVSGLGTSKDKRSADVYSLVGIEPGQLIAAYRGDWIARKIVDVPPFDMCRAWRDWQAEEPQIEKIEEEERRLGLRPKLLKALRLARLFGGSVAILGTGDAEPANELDIDRLDLGGLRYVHVVSRWEITAGQLNRDVLSDLFGEPEHYEVHSATGQVQRIHPSRVIRFCGAEIPDFGSPQDGWGDSVLQAVNDAVKNAALASGGIASLIHEAKVDVLSVPGLSEWLSTAENTKLLTERFAYAAQMKSLYNMLLLGGGAEGEAETWEQKQVDFSQFPDLIRTYLQIAAGAADIPATRLLGQAPAGMNATGESDVRNYYDRIAAEQEVWLRPALARLDEILIRSALGSRPPEVHYAWAPLWQMDEPQKADVALKKAQAFQIDVNAAVIPSDALARARVNQLVEDGTYPGLEGALDAAPESVEEKALREEEEAAAAAEEMQRMAAEPESNVVPIRKADELAEEIRQAVADEVAKHMPKDT